MHYITALAICLSMLSLGHSVGMDGCSASAIASVASPAAAAAGDLGFDCNSISDIDNADQVACDGSLNSSHVCSLPAKDKTLAVSPSEIGPETLSRAQTLVSVVVVTLEETVLVIDAGHSTYVTTVGPPDTAISPTAAAPADVATTKISTGTGSAAELKTGLPVSGTALSSKTGSHPSLATSDHPRVSPFKLLGSSGLASATTEAPASAFTSARAGNFSAEIHSLVSSLSTVEATIRSQAMGSKTRKQSKTDSKTDSITTSTSSAFATGFASANSAAGYAKLMLGAGIGVLAL